MNGLILNPTQETSLVLREEVDTLLSGIKGNEEKLSSDYIKLGSLLVKIKTTKAWLDWEFRTFDEYISSLKDKVGRGRTQIYQYIGVTENLLPSVGEENLAKIGITKALEMKRAMSASGRNPSPEIIETALDPNVGAKELREKIFLENNIVGTPPPGNYFDLGGFYCTADERDEILRAFDVAERTDPVTPADIPDWARRKSVMQKLSREYLGTYESEVFGGSYGE